LDNASVKAGSDEQFSALKKNTPPQLMGRSRGGLIAKIHFLVTANDRLGLAFCLSHSQDDDAKNAWLLLQN
jgi:hypothetical protein